jgi:hypothetical protein
MSGKELTWKTGLFLVLPGLLVYGCLRERADLVRVELAQRAYFKSLHSPDVTALTLVGQVSNGHLVHKHITDTAALQQWRRRAKYLRPVRSSGRLSFVHSPLRPGASQWSCYV